MKWDVFVTPAPRIESDDKPPGVTEVFFQATACTLIYGERDAVLVDALLTEEQANALADWVAGHERNLTHIYITHGHGDHWYGLRTLLARFPGAKGVSTRHTVDAMRKQSSPKALAHWEQSLPGKIPHQVTIAEPLEDNVIHLEGIALAAVELGHTDTDATTCLHVPSVGLVVAGDAAYNDVHLYLVESTHDTRQEWIAALDKMEALKPDAVVASHKRPDSRDDPHVIEETRQYIRDFDRLAETASNTLELYEAMLALYPNRVNPQWALWSSARAAMK